MAAGRRCYDPGPGENCHDTERCPLEEHAAPGPQRSGRLRQLRRGHGHPDGPRRAARDLARSRVGAEELHGRGRDGSAEAFGHRPDRSAPRRHALEQPGPGGRPAGGPLPDEPGRDAAGRRRVLRRGRSGQAALDRVLRRLRASLARRPPPVVRRRRLPAPVERRARLQAAQPQGRSVLPHRRRAPADPSGRGRALVATRYA